MAPEAVKLGTPIIIGGAAKLLRLNKGKLNSLERQVKQRISIRTSTTKLQATTTDAEITWFTSRATLVDVFITVVRALTRRNVLII